MIIKYSNILKNALIFSISCFSLAASAQTSKYDEAMIQIEQLNRIKANEILTQLLATNPGNSAAQYQAGLIDVYFNKHQEAKAHFNSVIQLEGPEKLDATFELSKLIYLNM